MSRRGAEKELSEEDRTHTDIRAAIDEELMLVHPDDEIAWLQGARFVAQFMFRQQAERKAESDGQHS